eukprot:843922-Rhodomonas_salina.1
MTFPQAFQSPNTALHTRSDPRCTRPHTAVQHRTTALQYHNAVQQRSTTTQYTAVHCWQDCAAHARTSCAVPRWQRLAARACAQRIPGDAAVDSAGRLHVLEPEVVQRRGGPLLVPLSLPQYRTPRRLLCSTGLHCP